MRLKAAVLLVVILGAVPALAQDNKPSAPLPEAKPPDSCAPIRSQLASDPTGKISRLFLWTPSGYQEVPRDSPFLFFSKYVLPEYHKQALPFLFAPARRHAEKKQFLAVRTRSSSATENPRVALWKNRKKYEDDVSFGQYQEYHLNPTTDDRVLRHYHRWGKDRSDVPDETRKSFAFSDYSDFWKKILGQKTLEERRLLTIPFSTSDDHQTCFKFTMRPDPKEIQPDEEDNDQISLTKSFTIEVMEVRAYDEKPGEKFTINYQKN